MTMVANPPEDIADVTAISSSKLCVRSLLVFLPFSLEDSGDMNPDDDEDESLPLLHLLESSNFVLFGCRKIPSPPGATERMDGWCSAGWRLAKQQRVAIIHNTAVARSARAPVYQRHVAATAAVVALLVGLHKTRV